MTMRVYSNKTFRDRMRLRWYAVEVFFKHRVWGSLRHKVERMNAKMKKTQFLCPRRNETPGPFNLPEFDFWRHDETCSYCGSMSQELFMLNVEAGKELGPTDKNYKVYVEPRGKFYFQHLDKAQRMRFVEMLNKKDVTIGHPGHFYVKPFFISYGPAIPTSSLQA